MVLEAALVLCDLKKAVFISDFFMPSLTDRASAPFEANMIRLMSLISPSFYQMVRNTFYWKR